MNVLFAFLLVIPALAQNNTEPATNTTLTPGNAQECENNYKTAILEYSTKCIQVQAPEIINDSFMNTICGTNCTSAEAAMIQVVTSPQCALINATAIGIPTSNNTELVADRVKYFKRFSDFYCLKDDDGYCALKQDLYRKSDNKALPVDYKMPALTDLSLLCTKCVKAISAFNLYFDGGSNNIKTYNDELVKACKKKEDKPLENGDTEVLNKTHQAQENGIELKQASIGLFAAILMMI